eukprot:INCI20111.1.p2 GENE.INCI20111.1~~INCI20111.1.p2  ORF type:complete len:100 (+),score=18.15 INCI20111.1:375-674(+)
MFGSALVHIKEVCQKLCPRVSGSLSVGLERLFLSSTWPQNIISYNVVSAVLSVVVVVHFWTLTARAKLLKRVSALQQQLTHETLLQRVEDRGWPQAWPS